MRDQIKQAQRRAVQYWFIDGLAELGLGATFLLLGLYFAALQIWPDSRWVSLGMMAVLFLLAFGGRSVMQRIKTHSTYPRSGYVSYGWTNQRELVFTAIFSILVLGAVLFLRSQNPGGFVWTPVIFGLILVFFFAWIGYTAALSHFFFLAFLSLLGGGALAFSGLGDWPATAVLSVLLGLVLLVSGGMRRRDYLRQYSGQLEAPDER